MSLDDFDDELNDDERIPPSLDVIETDLANHAVEVYKQTVQRLNQVTDISLTFRGLVDLLKASGGYSLYENVQRRFDAYIDRNAKLNFPNDVASNNPSEEYEQFLADTEYMIKKFAVDNMEIRVFQILGEIIEDFEGKSHRFLDFLEDELDAADALYEVDIYEEFTQEPLDLVNYAANFSNKMQVIHALIIQKYKTTK